LPSSELGWPISRSYAFGAADVESADDFEAATNRMGGAAPKGRVIAYDEIGRFFLPSAILARRL
jgi:hypothetical protein